MVEEWGIVVSSGSDAVVASSVTTGDVRKSPFGFPECRGVMTKGRIVGVARPRGGPRLGRGPHAHNSGSEPIEFGLTPEGPGSVPYVSDERQSIRDRKGVGLERWHPPTSFTLVAICRSCSAYLVFFRFTIRVLGCASCRAILRGFLHFRRGDCSIQSPTDCSHSDGTPKLSE